MCGIVGYVGHRPVQEVLLAGLEKLEYRGYDSAGISMQAEGRLDSVRAVGNLSALRAAVEDSEEEDAGGGVAVAAPPATTGIGHTRWATHGRVTEENAHPHYDTDDRVHIVLNGIVVVVVRVGVGLGDAPVGGPAGVADACRGLRLGGRDTAGCGLRLNGVLQELEVADGAHGVDLAIGEKREPG